MRDPEGAYPGHRPRAAPENGPYFAIPCEEGCGRPAALATVIDGALAQEIRARYGDELHVTLVTVEQLQALVRYAPHKPASESSGRSLQDCTRRTGQPRQARLRH